MRVFAVIVAYNPNIEHLKALVALLCPDCDGVAIVDNTDAGHYFSVDDLVDTAVAREKIHLLRCGTNRGIAAALNLGIALAVDVGADFILLSDQDSLPVKGMVGDLIHAYFFMVEKGVNIGAVGPTITDLHTGLTYKFQARVPGKIFYGHKLPTREDFNVEALTLITSGTLIPAEVIRDVGSMYEEFFIDHVDIEWCHRARSKGYKLFGTGWATLYQRMGEALLPVWFFGWRYESYYGPIRIYYRVRNFVVLCGFDYVDRRWKIRNALYWLKVIGAHLIFASRRYAFLKMIGIGVYHGLIRRMGPYVE